MKLPLFFTSSECFKEFPNMGKVYVSPFTGKKYLVSKCGLDLRIERFIRFLQLIYFASLVASWLLGRFVGLNILLMSVPPLFVVLMSYICEQRLIRQLREVKFEESAEAVNATRTPKLMAVYLFSSVSFLYLVSETAKGTPAIDLLWPFVMFLAALCAIYKVHVSRSNLSNIDVPKSVSPSLEKKFKLTKLVSSTVFLVADSIFIFSTNPGLVRWRESIAHSGEIAVYAFVIVVVFIFPWEI